MSKLYNSYLELKEKDSNFIYLFKNGVFFIALDEDAIKLSNIFSFKLSNFTPSVVKCGFPCSSFEKYSKLFSACNLNIKIIGPAQSTSYLITDYAQNENITKLLNSIKLLDVNNLSVKEAYNFLEELQKSAKEII